MKKKYAFTRVEQKEQAKKEAENRRGRFICTNKDLETEVKVADLLPYILDIYMRGK